jgi:hypothetical protein
LTHVVAESDKSVPVGIGFPVIRDSRDPAGAFDEYGELGER